MTSYRHSFIVVVMDYDTRLLARLFLLAVVIGLSGCVSSTLDKAVAQCSATDGKASYTRSEGYERFSCAS